jgi:hypothetical protein
MVLLSLPHGKNMYDTIQPTVQLLLIYFKRNRKTEKKKKKAPTSGGEAGGKEATQ